MDVDGHDHCFVFSPSGLPGRPGERLGVHMDVNDEDGHLFDASVGQRRQP